MLSIEQIKQIVGYIWKSVPYEVFEENEDIIVKTNLGYFYFDPIDDDADAMRVFKALVDECKKFPLIMEISHGSITIGKEIELGKPCLFQREFNNESICLAYLAVMESK